MAKRIAPLSDTQLSKAKPREKEYALRDGGGLYLVVVPTGGKLWRMDYRFAGKRLCLSLGPYPILTLAQAREKRTEAQRQILSGINPGTVKKALKETHTVKNSFEAVAREWHLKFASTWTKEHAERKLQRLTTYIFVELGQREIDEITAQDLLAALNKIKSADIMHRVRYDCVQVLRYGIATGRCSRNIADDLRGSLPPVKGGHHAAITAPKELGAVYESACNYHGAFVTRVALQLQILLFVRPTELRTMEWSELDFETGMWNIPAEKMKMKIAHIVPLCKQAVGLLKTLAQVTGSGRYVFPCVTSKQRPMSENTVNVALRRLGYTKEEVTGHGFRATARTIMDEVLKVRVDLIEHQLAHKVKDPNGRAYNRTQYIEDRAVMMQQWADYLDGLIQ